MAGDSPVVPLPAETEAKPDAHTAPVARPMAPKASQAASRPRGMKLKGLDTAPFLFWPCQPADRVMMATVFGYRLTIL